MGLLKYFSRHSVPAISIADSVLVRRLKSPVRAQFFSRLILGTITLYLLISGVNVIYAEQRDSFGVVKNPIELWAGEIGAAKNNVMIATYKFSSKEALQALAEARARGVGVKLLVDGKEATKSEKQIKKAIQTGINVYIWPTDKLGEFHAKFSIIDEEVLVMGSFNLSKAAADNNTESFIISQDSILIRTATNTFMELIKQTERMP